LIGLLPKEVRFYVATVPLFVKINSLFIICFL